MTLEEMFKKPENEYSLAPFWFWNDDLDIQHLKWQMDEMLKNGVNEIVISSRLGIEIEYLSDLWFEKIQVVTKYAKTIDMKIWIYDEDNWPSGYAGGKVLEENADFCGKNVKELQIQVDDNKNLEEYELPEKIVATILLRNNVYTECDLKENLQKGDTIFIYYQEYTLWNPAYSKGYFVDMLNKESTKSFIKHTHQRYKDIVGSYFGNTIKGFFVDEPGFYNNLELRQIGDNASLAWTDEFPNYFLQHNGYDIIKNMHHIWTNIDENTKKIRVDVYETLCMMYKENYLDILKQFCEENNMLLIGHLHYEEFFKYQIITQGNFYNALKSLNIVGLDRIDKNAEKLSEKYVSSAGHQMGSPRVMSETYALFGWELSLQEMKKWIDYQYVRGVNMLVPHAFYSSIEGKRSDECPPSEFYQNPYWEHFHIFSHYAKRLSFLLSQGAHSCPVALFYPIVSAQSKYNTNNKEEIDCMDKEFQKFGLALLENQIDYDILYGEALMEGTISENGLGIQNENYRVIIFSQCSCLTLNEINKLFCFVNAGGVIIFVDEIPYVCLDNLKQNEYTETIDKMLQLNNVKTIPKRRVYKSYTFKHNVLAIKEILYQCNSIDFMLEIEDNDLRYLHRVIGSDDVYFITNESNNKKDNAVLFFGEKYASVLNAENGDEENTCFSWVEKPSIYIGTDPIGNALNIEGTRKLTRVDLKLHPYGSVIIRLSNTKKNYLSNDTIKTETTKTTKILNNIWEIIVGDEIYYDKWGAIEYFDKQYFSGEIIYKTDLTITPNIDLTTVILEATKVRDCLEVIVNGHSIGARVWAPYQFDIGHHLKEGNNQIELKVLNSLVNSLKKTQRLSGILGDIYISYSLL